MQQFHINGPYFHLRVPETFWPGLLLIQLQMTDNASILRLRDPKKLGGAQLCGECFFLSECCIAQWVRCLDGRPSVS